LYTDGLEKEFGQRPIIFFTYGYDLFIWGDVKGEVQCWFYGFYNMDFEIIGEITNIQPIARGTSVRDRTRLSKFYGPGRWRKLKGTARIRLLDNSIRLAEIHWYEAHGIGRKEFKIKLPFLG
jgi:type I site-specific restriction endonuclease